jgi:hypothetical protein
MQAVLDLLHRRGLLLWGNSSVNDSVKHSGDADTILRLTCCCMALHSSGKDTADDVLELEHTNGANSGASTSRSEDG